MAIAKFPHNIKLDDVVVEREGRQRRDLGDLESLKRSIAKIGLLNPITIARGTKKLIAGERRLTAFKELRAAYDTYVENGDDSVKEYADPNPYVSIPFRYFDSLDEVDAQIVELEENAQRSDLKWHDSARTVFRLAQLILTEDEDWYDRKSGQTSIIGNTKVGERLNFSAAYVAMCFKVGRELAEGREDLLEAGNLVSAHNRIQRTMARELDDATGDFISSIMPAVRKDAQPVGVSVPTGIPSSPIPLPVDAPQGAPATQVAAGAKGTPTARQDAPTVAVPSPASPIHQADFLTWAPEYSGPRFNLIHCDFPYGINFQDHAANYTPSDRKSQKYEDSPDVYWALVNGFLRNQEHFVADSAHCMFWFSMIFYERTCQLFESHGWEVNRFPMIWAKNKGILPSPDYGPRRNYETCLLMSRGRRKIVKAVSNHLYHNASDGDKLHHVSEKPMAVVLHFLSMLVDANSTVLDPTCGSGTAIRAADELKASRLLGLEIDAERAAAAQKLWAMSKLIE